MMDLGALHFLDIFVTRSVGGFFLFQRQYVVDLLQRASVAKCHSTSTLVDTRAKLSSTDVVLVTDLIKYKSLVSAL